MTPSFASHLISISWSLLHLSLCLMITAVAVVATSKDSVFRLAAMPCLLLAASRLFHEWKSISTSVTINTVLVGEGIFLLLQCTNFVIFARLDGPRLQQAGVLSAQSSLGSKLLRTTRLLLNLRGIGTPWEAKHVENSSSRASGLSAHHRKYNYLVRQSLIICWQYMFLDVVYQSSLANGPAGGSNGFPIDFEFQYFGLSSTQWAIRVLISLFSGLGPARVQIDLMYRLCGLSAVLIGFAKPQDWPPLFGSIREAYSLRRFWTHFIRRNIIRLPHHGRWARWDRHCHVFFVFLASGILHAATDYYVVSPSSYQSQFACVAFFTSFSLGIAIEDLVFRLWGRLSPESASPAGSGVVEPSQFSLMKSSALECIGFVWVATWMTLTAPWMLFPRVRLPVEDGWLVPWSVTRSIGMSHARMALVFGGLLTKVAISGQI
ncbi:hypothetical protein E4U54_004422 [Claviceps lovelessii]|nr:hypothetical protein E4U54_004422 [Claviceps lovelessii]